MTEAKTRSYLWIWGTQDEIRGHWQFGVAYFVAFCRFKSHFVQSSVEAMSAWILCKSSHNYWWGEERCPHCWSLSLASRISERWQQAGISPGLVVNCFHHKNFALTVSCFVLSVFSSESDPVSFSSRPSPLQRCVFCALYEAGVS